MYSFLLLLCIVTFHHSTLHSYYLLLVVLTMFHLYLYPLLLKLFLFLFSPSWTSENVAHICTYCYFPYIYIISYDVILIFTYHKIHLFLCFFNLFTHYIRHFICTYVQYSCVFIPAFRTFHTLISVHTLVPCITD